MATPLINSGDALLAFPFPFGRRPLVPFGRRPSFRLRDSWLKKNPCRLWYPREKCEPDP